MARGKETCRILKEIRRQIAEANDIEFVTSDCPYKGDCIGTCPKCEAEVRYLEQQLRARSIAGKAVALAGISAASFAMFMPLTVHSKNSTYSDSRLKIVDSESHDTIEIGGQVLFEEIAPDGTVLTEPLIGAIVLNNRTDSGACTDVDGRFKLNVCIGDTLEISYVGCVPQSIAVTDCNEEIEVTLEADETLLGEIPLVGAIGRRY